MVASTPLPALVPSNRVEQVGHTQFSAAHQQVLSRVDSPESARFSPILHRKRLFLADLAMKYQQQTVRLNGGEQVTPGNLLPTEEVEQLRQENHQLTQRLKQAELLLDIQKEILQLLSATLEVTRSNTGEAT